MPSLSHRLVSFVLPRLNPKSTIRDVEKFRAALVEHNKGRLTMPPESVRRSHDIEVIDLGFPAYVVTRRGSSAWSRTIVHLHGGSFTSPSHKQQWKWALRLAAKTDARLVFPAYPLAPEFSWRDSHEPLVGMVESLLGEGPVVLAGDSAGGGLALALAESIRDRGGPQPSHLLLIAPWVDLTGSAPGTEEAAARDPWLHWDNHHTYAMFWAGTAEDLARPEVSPGLGRLDGLPPTLMFCGTHDMLYPGCVVLAERAEETGWDLEFVVGHGMLHVYPILPISEARPALRQAASFINGGDITA